MSFSIVSLIHLILCHDPVMEQLRGKVAVVTGAASGIGQALARRLVAEGMRVLGADVEPVTAEDVLPFVADVSNADDVAALADHAYTTLGAVDVLCNNAGVFAGGLMWERATSDFTWTLGVNLWGILHAIRAFVPRMLAAGRSGHIVNTVSMAGVCTNAFSGPYTISKFAALAATECLAHDLAGVGAPIKVSAVVPGAVATQIATSGRNRPAVLAAPRGEDTVFVEQALADVTRAHGAAPEDVADLIVAAIHAERFLVPTRPSYAAQISARADALIAKRLPPMPVFD
jgi:NAD(P)-dependent dehydrogenase (short-subunit alcohol dehydrogenase family)